jgi:hypothetical protein
MPYLQSDMIEAVSYDERTRLLKVKFRTDGHVAVYENVPQETYDSLIFADSIGEYFETYIAGTYRLRDESAGELAGKLSPTLAASVSRSRATFNSRVR